MGPSEVRTYNTVEAAQSGSSKVKPCHFISAVYPSYMGAGTRCHSHCMLRSSNVSGLALPCSVATSICLSCGALQISTGGPYTGETHRINTAEVIPPFRGEDEQHRPANPELTPHELFPGSSCIVSYKTLSILSRSGEPWGSR